MHGGRKRPSFKRQNSSLYYSYFLVFHILRDYTVCCFRCCKNYLTQNTSTENDFITDTIYTQSRGTGSQSEMTVN